MCDRYPKTGIRSVDGHTIGPFIIDEMCCTKYIGDEQHQITKKRRLSITDIHPGRQRRATDFGALQRAVVDRSHRIANAVEKQRFVVVLYATKE